MTLGTTLLVLLFLAWGLQLVLAHRQARIFMRSVGELRASGTTAVGVGGKGWGRARTYVALAAGADGVVRGARRLRGSSVFAKPSDLPDLEGRRLADLVKDEADDQAKAAAMAAKTLLEAQAERGADAANP
jgi:glucitol operon activator protein